MECFLSGGALGVDQWAADIVLDLKAEELKKSYGRHCNIKLIVAQPFPSQSAKWPQEVRRRYEKILQKAIEVSGAKRGYLLLAGLSGKLELKTKKSDIKEDGKYSRNIVDEVYKKGIEWDGLDLGYRAKTANMSPHETLDAEHLKYAKDEHSRDVYQNILCIAVQLGMEQGRRQKMSEVKNALKLIDSGFSAIERLREVISNVMEAEDKDILKDVNNGKYEN